MKNSTSITGINSKISFHKRVLQKFVNNKFINPTLTENTSKKDSFIDDYEPITFTSTPVPISGRLDIHFDARHPEDLTRISIPVESSFLVTCTKEGLKDYRMTWSSSLS